MGNVEKDNTIQFLDLTGIDEQERHWLLSTLFSANERIRFPWKSCSQAKLNGKNYAEIASSSYETHVKNGLLNCTENVVSKANVNVSYKVDIDPQVLSHPGSHQILSEANRIQSYAVHSQSTTSSVVQQLNTTKYSPLNNLGFQANDVKEPVISLPGNHSANSLTQDSSRMSINNNKNYDCSYEGYNNLKCETALDSYIKCDNISSENEDVSAHTNSKEDLKQNDSDEKQKLNNVNVSTPVNSWASLFNKPKNEKPSESVIQSKPHNFEQVFSQNNNSNNKGKHPKIYLGDPCLHRMGEFFINFTVKNQIISLQPRGLINKSNYCYINSILQALIACPPFYNLFYELSRDTSFLNEKRKDAPVITNVMKFINEFNHLPADLRINRRTDKNSKKKELKVMINCDPPIEPNYIYKMLNGIRTDTFLVEGRQEDAEEFLGCLLNGLNDEMLELIKIVDDVYAENNINIDKSKTDDNQLDKDKEWQVMGPKNKGSVTRRMEFIKTPISNIFGGSLRSRIHRAGDLSTDNIQPFFTLPLNIEKATSVREALEVLISKNQLEGVTSSRTNQEVEAWQQVTLEQLPVVLILHLKCFDYKMDGCSKIIKALEFPVDLKIDSKLLSSKNNYTAKEKQYKLFAVVYHDGKEATKGHYITDSYHIGYASWLRYDDSSVKVVLEDQVLKPHGTKVPYLLFYRRSDSVKSK
ncbi:ubiquitin carboxyl-terminal hydrolase 10 [Agrilus planipennis]|uniref:ubiquitinyl hydrolase 1 n=1 Tax=Agrilus planipennis TaxID=224129 RepID=A0A1W4XGK6_AGRPL|nr:ubiquitin carboxyl-terminal hydrolase 10 [Agrilus planipennis]